MDECERATVKAAQMKLIQSLPYSYSRASPKDVDGVSNYYLTVQKPGSKNALRLYFADTGAWGTFTANQSTYFKSIAKKFRGDNAPAIMFFHIPTVHYANFTGGNGTQGTQGESVTSGIDNAALFDTMVAMGDVKASFVGHDHYNDFCFLEKPIHLCYGGGGGYGAAYGSPKHSRRARVIEWSLTAKKETIETYICRQTEANDFAKYTIYDQSFSSI
ncbi:unnamed protein product [Aphanomyces euteiches]|uniref:Calcineurin-like phosphoesterase domain-containing protein n=1 Tax=Aphanomyces euteiches TaxID=100861 RepID=A0A6G0WGH1_9STRA|nr:hypothetical protein Ae201684_015494 [Aphanomyces euteiches]KAH9084007.1 hypothetical protein Ae201684P_020270 [Aphanomyces euteiches]KAH9148585.1 hypothetical protein AeRB84_008099 [Aphanomyces euteiches]